MRELIEARVIAVDIAVLTKEEIAQSSIEVKVKPDASAGLTSSDSSCLDLAEVFGEPSLETCVLEALEATASSVSLPWHGG